MKVEKAIFAAGCFWGRTTSVRTYSGCTKHYSRLYRWSGSNPTYTQVKAHMTHHVEAIFVDYDADMVSYVDLCKLFFEIHDPSQTDGIGPDLGPQYRSMIFYMDEKQKSEAEEVIELLRSKGHRVNTKLRPAEKFWEAEDYHQHYYDKTGGEPYCHIRVKKF